MAENSHSEKRSNRAARSKRVESGEAARGRGSLVSSSSSCVYTLYIVPLPHLSTVESLRGGENIVCVPVGVLLIDSREQRRLSSTLPTESNCLPDSERVSRSLFEQFNFRVKEGRDRQIQQELRHLRITTEQPNVSVKNFSGIINYSSEANIVSHPSIVTQLCHSKPCL